MNTDYLLELAGISRQDAAYYYISDLLETLRNRGAVEYETAAQKFKVSVDDFIDTISNAVAAAHAEGRLEFINLLLNCEFCKEGIIVTNAEFLHALNLCLNCRRILR